MKTCITAVVAAALIGCSQFVLDPTNHPCSAGECPKGFVCHPEISVCGLALAIDCDAPDGLCPSRISTGDSCAAESAYVSCYDTVSDCRAGCRTCGEDLRWSECSPGCVRGLITTCADCFDDCTETVLNATPVCEPSGDTHVCSYAGACADSFVDADGDTRNGCECTPTNGTVEICDGIDNDCGGAIDEELTACQCTSDPPSAEVCDAIDNDCNEAIDDTFECISGETRRCDAGTGPDTGTETCVTTACIWSGVCVPDNPGGAPDNPADLVATDGEDSQVTVTFTMPPAPVEECVLLRTAGAYPVDHSDAFAVQVATFSTADAFTTEVDTGTTNGTTYYYVVFCHNGEDWNDTLGANADTALPIDAVQDFDAVDGEDAQIRVSYTMPIGATACKVIRNTSAFPAAHDDGVQVGAEETGGGAKTATDGGLVNGSPHYYAAFCRVDASYRNVAVDSTPPGNADIATPIALVADLDATDGEDQQTTLDFTMPAGATGCKLLRNDVDYPAGSSDGTQVGPEVTAGPVVDSNLTNGATYFYAAFCHVDGIYRNDTVVAGQNGDTAVPSGCGSGTVVVDTQSATCSVALPGTADVTLAHLTVTSSCPNMLDTLQVDSHPDNTAPDTNFTNVRLLEDRPPPGLDGDDWLLTNPTTIAGGTASFSGLSFPLSPGVPHPLLVVADVSSTIGRGVYAAQVTSPASFSVLDPPGTQSLAATPLVGGVMTLSPSLCTVPPDFGDGSLPALAVSTIGGLVSWTNGSGDEAGASVYGGDNGTDTSDCDLESAGAMPTWLDVWDQGAGTRFVHLDTGIPLSMPICSGLQVRIVGSAYNPGIGACSFNRMVDFASVVLYVYDSATTVDASTGMAIDITSRVTFAGTTPTAGCDAHYVDLDVTGLFNYAVANALPTTNLELRIIFEVRASPSPPNLPNMNSNDDIRVSIPEIYVYLP